MNEDVTCTVIFSKTPILDGCFADSNTNVDLQTYTTGKNGTYGLLNRINEGANSMGYVLSDPNPTRVEQTKAFRTKLAGNINKYITSRYCPNKDLTGFWDAHPSSAALINPVL